MSHADPTDRRDPIATDDRRDDAMRREDDRDRLGDRDRGSDDADRRDDGRADRRDDDRARDRVEGASDRSRDGEHAGSQVGIDERWEATQAQFLESPRDAVAAADELVNEVIDDVRRRLDAERAAVADTWKRDGSDTEDLRTAMLRYREVLDRLVSQR